MSVYEIAIHNEQVRELMRQGERHRTFSDDWADTHYIEFTADSPDDAVAKCRRKYPQEEGFVIEQVTEAA